MPFVEFDLYYGGKLLLNSEAIIKVKQILEEGEVEYCEISSTSNYSNIVKHTFDEVRKRLGLPIIPRAETLAKLT